MVGSGIGGLTAALLARVGKKVRVLEQHCADGCMYYEFLSLITAHLVEWYPMDQRADGIYDSIDVDDIYTT